MNPSQALKISLLTGVLVIVFTSALEYHFRNRGFVPTYNDDKVLWATTRKKVYASPENATVVIGSSRIKFDLDIPTWKKLTGEDVIQLAMVGTSPRPLLRDLANDENFKGKLMIDVVEGLFFSPRTFISEKSAREAIEYFEKETPAQRVSAILNHQMESGLVLLEEGKFGLNNLLNDLQLPNRPGVFSFPSFPHEFAMATGGRQTVMTPMFLSNPELLKVQIGNWIKLGGIDKTPGIKGEALETVFKEVKDAVDKIKARGGQVVFVRPPSSDGFLEAELIAHPREEYWDAMLKYTDTPGIHFADYPTTANFSCPEWSHLHPKDVLTYTEALVDILKRDINWEFKKSVAI
jgi:hypothetical protein